MAPKDMERSARLYTAVTLTRAAGGTHTRLRAGQGRPGESWHSRHRGLEAAQQAIEHLDLALRRDPVRIQHALRGETVYEHDELMCRYLDIAAAGELAALPCLLQMTVQPGAEPVELRMLQVAKLRVPERAAPEADLDLRLEVAALVERQRLQHDDAQRRQAGQARRRLRHPGADAAVRVHERRAEYVGLVVEVVPEDAARAVRLLGDRPDGRAGDAVASDHPPGGREDLVSPLVPVDDLGHRAPLQCR